MSKSMNAMVEHSASASELLKLISNQQRLMILCLLHDNEMSVGKLNEHLPSLSQSALSQHLAQLRKANLVKNKRQSQTILYSLADSKALEVINLLHKLYCEPNK
ncbi:ArsR/SmtB family transcription factor [Marinicella gelatinilytica]|uniref:ArsR/SmtB family transcription factor n=1 Tax=Marinicella gelatinilytica TaxID=2996017 RepID=UPI0022609DA4|nr:metalloregulator ArsR/SmtB family transcription factor [Marinicella gelatinilytica]MCX7545465.1 metalloregulator ArsR/SmtB family transcription factor [Marinicella gelatinilytica]